MASALVQVVEWLYLDEVWERHESERYRACQMREIQIPAKFCTSRMGKRPSNPKSRREVKETGVFCTSRMGREEVADRACSGAVEGK